MAAKVRKIWMDEWKSQDGKRIMEAKQAMFQLREKSRMFLEIIC